MTSALPTPGFSIPDKLNPSDFNGAAEFRRGIEERREGQLWRVWRGCRCGKGEVRAPKLGLCGAGRAGVWD